MYQVNTKIRKMKCTLCGGKIHPKRLKIIPGTKTCVECSTTSQKKGAIVVGGAGDHTWVDLMVMEEDQYVQYEESKKLNKKDGGLDNITE